MRVLLPVDTDENRAIAAAETVLSLPNAVEEVQVTILNVEKELEVAGEAGHVSSEEWYDEEDFPAAVEKAKAVLEDAGLAVETRRAHGEPAETIIAVADEIDADQIILAGRQRTPVGKVLFGSVTQSVLLTADVPVTVVPTSS